MSFSAGGDHCTWKRITTSAIRRRFGMSISGESEQVGKCNINRRAFAKMTLGGAASLASAGRGAAKLAQLPNGIKIGTGARNPTGANMLYIRQLGVAGVTRPG